MVGYNLFNTAIEGSRIVCPIHSQDVGLDLRGKLGWKWRARDFNPISDGEAMGTGEISV